MTQLGESAAVGLVDSLDMECPFHVKAHTHDSAKNNFLAGDATALGENLESGGVDSSTVQRNELPDKDYRSPRKEVDPDKYFSEAEREVQIVKGGTEDTKYPVAYSAHHLIPAKESLKPAAALHKYIDKGKGKICCNLGYDIDGNENGVWLPGLHAVNSKGLNLWGYSSTDLPDAEDVGRKVVLRSELEDRTTKWKYSPLDGPKPADGSDAFEPTNMKWLYVQKAMIFPKLAPRQFHDRHPNYSELVMNHLNDVAAVLDRLSGNKVVPASCSKCKSANEKASPPVGLLGLLNRSSRWYRGKLVGRVRDSDYYTSSWCGPDSPALVLPKKGKKAKRG